MVLLATVRKYQLCNRLPCMKRTAQTILLSTMQSKKLDSFRNLSTIDDSDKTQLKEEICSINKPPERPDIGMCCESGCKNCVWLEYVVAVRFYYGNDKREIAECFELYSRTRH
ncbi:hypothetical protein HNY73_004706 [Argiope bruennichi]|uniref:Oxidoreductase-like domain-containing protein n=1 Tax=Argiope bruennichi TaxID=94029 RepID=A0A8T0FRE9_ARGBR|nr:hypothetical protein HNY73_004706 [Argiope bruennichi]